MLPPYCSSSNDARNLKDFCGSGDHLTLSDSKWIDASVGSICSLDRENARYENAIIRVFTSF